MDAITGCLMARLRPSILILSVVPFLLLLGFAFSLGDCAALPQRETISPLAGLLPGTNKEANSFLTAAWLAMGKNDLHTGLMRAESAIKLDPNLGQAYLVKGVCLFELDHAHEAIDALKHGLAILPDNGKDVYARIASEPAYSRHVLASALETEGRSAESLAVLLQADKFYPNSCLIGGDLGDYYRSRHQDALAIKYYSQSVASGFGTARESRAHLYLQSGKADLALADADLLIKKDPDNLRYYMLRSKIYKKMGKATLAERDLLKANNGSLEQF
jgi:tetratricopeptide (TPR) repeat protein